MRNYHDLQVLTENVKVHCPKGKYVISVLDLKLILRCGAAHSSVEVSQTKKNATHHIFAAQLADPYPSEKVHCYRCSGSKSLCPITSNSPERR
jgi:hypothetical protein